MRSRTEVVVGRDATVRRLDCAPPWTVRQVRSECGGVAALCQVNTAAGPLGGDELALCLRLEPGARATLEATGAVLAQGGASRMRTTVDVGTAATLVARPGALVVAANASVDVDLEIDLAADAALDWREIVVLGRAGKPGGRAVLRWHVRRSGRPVLRQHMTLGPDDWRGVRDGRRVLVTAFSTDPHLTAVTTVRSPTAVAARLDEHTLLATVLADDAATAEAELDLLVPRRQASAQS